MAEAVEAGKTREKREKNERKTREKQEKNKREQEGTRGNKREQEGNKRARHLTQAMRAKKVGRKSFWCASEMTGCGQIIIL